MKYLLIIFIGLFLGKPGPHPDAVSPHRVVDASPLAVFDKSWNDAVYTACNTAADAAFMNAREKELIYILNLARRYPAQFANTVVKQYPAYSHNEKMAQSDHY